MVLGAKALAVLRGRGYALPADVRELARDVLRHRLVLSCEAPADDLLGPLLGSVPLPEVEPERGVRSASRNAVAVRSASWRSLAFRSVLADFV